MKIQKIVTVLIFLIGFLVIPTHGFTQISSDANELVPTEYSSGSSGSNSHFLWSEGDLNASLTATSPNAESATFDWLKYNVQSGTFDLFSGAFSDNTTSTISSLEDGCYRVNITSTSGVKKYTAWVFNNYIDATAEITASDCNSFTLKGNIEPQTLTYVDLTNEQKIILNKGIKVKWSDGNTFSERTVYTPPTKDTEYTFEVIDRFGCVSNRASVIYNSIVTKASFEYKKEDQTKSHTTKTEAPLTVTFTNTSENADADKYEWFIYRDYDEILRESKENKGKVIDSIMTKIYSANPIYTFEKSGKYNVKLVSKKKSEFTTCFDTVYIDNFIEIDTSFIEAPNVFTPDGNGANDQFVVRFFSMKTVKISIFNRWGKLIHVWESNNVQGFGPTIESTPQAVWDGKVGGKFAVPGVYYYVVEGIGRDDKRNRANGFFHLFRAK